MLHAIDVVCAVDATPRYTTHATHAEPDVFLQRVPSTGFGVGLGLTTLSLVFATLDAFTPHQLSPAFRLLHERMPARTSEKWVE